MPALPPLTTTTRPVRSNMATLLSLFRHPCESRSPGLSSGRRRGGGSLGGGDSRLGVEGVFQSGSGGGCRRHRRGGRGWACLVLLEELRVADELARDRLALVHHDELPVLDVHEVGAAGRGR